MKRIKNTFLIICGTISLILGLIGILLPLIPTIPFVLLASVCYLNSSKKLYNLIVENRYIGKYIVKYNKDRSLPLKFKISTLVVLWASTLFSTFIIVKNSYIKMFLMLVIILVTVHISKLKTYNE